MSNPRTILKKTALVASSTLLSRFLGFIREILMIHYLGVSGFSDAFITAFKIPNSLRKIFAEGALSAAFVPTLVNTIKHKGNKSIAGLMSLAFLFFEGIVVLLSALIILYPEPLLRIIAPGFSVEQIHNAAPILRLLMPLLFFISSSALLAGALQAIGHFFIPAFAPVLFNIIFIMSLVVCIFFNFSINALCWFIMCAGAIQLLLHCIAYFKASFTFDRISTADKKIFFHIIHTFLLCIPSIGLMEIALFIDTSFASYLAPGTVSLLFYANRFVGMPLGVFAVAFSTILLPHFAKLTTYTPKRLHFYLLESAKFIFWGTFPITLLMIFFSENIFSTLFLAKNFTLIQVREAALLLTIFASSLFFFSLNKIILNIFYAMHVAWIPMTVSALATVINIVLDMLLINHLQAAGLALATTIAGIVQTILFLTVLHKKYRFNLYLSSFGTFLRNYLTQIFLFTPFFIFFYYGIIKLIRYMPITYYIFFTAKIGLWLWVGPLSLIFFVLIWYTRVLFNVKLHFLP